MRDILVLDSGPLSEVAGDPRKPKIAVALTRFQVERAGKEVVIPEIADDEVRRELLRVGATASLLRLDALRGNFLYDPITTDVMLLAARYWATSRRSGLPTSDIHALDADVILAAQATLLAGPGDHVIVATTNVKHLVRFVDARDWAAMG